MPYPSGPFWSNTNTKRRNLAESPLALSIIRCYNYGPEHQFGSIWFRNLTMHGNDAAKADTPLIAGISGRIADMIQRQVLPAGHVLPTERELSHDFGVS